MGLSESLGYSGMCVCVSHQLTTLRSITIGGPFSVDHNNISACSSPGQVFRGLSLHVRMDKHHHHHRLGLFLDSSRRPRSSTEFSQSCEHVSFCVLASFTCYEQEQIDVHLNYLYLNTREGYILWYIVSGRVRLRNIVGVSDTKKNKTRYLYYHPRSISYNSTLFYLCRLKCSLLPMYQHTSNQRPSHFASMFVAHAYHMM